MATEWMLTIKRIMKENPGMDFKEVLMTAKKVYHLSNKSKSVSKKSGKKDKKPSRKVSKKNKTGKKTRKAKKGKKSRK